MVVSASVEVEKQTPADPTFRSVVDVIPVLLLSFAAESKRSVGKVSTRRFFCRRNALWMLVAAWLKLWVTNVCLRVKQMSPSSQVEKP